MIPELGHFALILAFCCALLQATVPVIGLYSKQKAIARMAKSLVSAQFLFVSLAFLSLMWAFIVSDFSVVYVAENSSKQLPLFYRAFALWGAHEGSMLLWVSILALWSFLVSRNTKQLPEEAWVRVLVVLGWVSVGFYLFLLATSNPFLRVFQNIPLNGRDLNPLLQDPGFIGHPPMLYMGYVGFSVPFAFAIAGLWLGNIQQQWVSWLKPWTLAAWCFLTLGITLGSWWAYRELGWGGFWFWDPVENASFLPWLVGTALIHSIAVAAKRNQFKGWLVILAISAFSLSLLGTFLVRSGVLTSVHAFAVDPTRGIFMLSYFTVVVGSSLLLYSFRVNKVNTKSPFALFSRESFLLFNNVILLAAMLTVLLGTLYPLIIQALGLGKLSVGAPYFNTVFVPLVAPLLFLMAIAPLVKWREMQFKQLGWALILLLLASIAFGLFMPYWVLGSVNGSAAMGLTLGAWIILTITFYVIKSISNNNFAFKSLGMLCAHLGIAVTVIGITAVTHFSIERNVSMQVGDSLKLGAYTLKFEDVSSLKGANFTGDDALFEVIEDGHVNAVIHAQKRLYTVANQVMTDAGINAGFTRDLYVALGEPLNDNAWAVRLYYKPFVRWIWLGGILMLLGGLISLFRKYLWSAA